MSRSCEFCGGEIHELARTGNHVWVGCRRCQRSWRDDLDAASAATPVQGPACQPSRSFLESALGQYVTAAAAVAVAFSVRLALKPLTGNASPFLLFTPAVMVAAWYGGIGPAALATGVGAVLGNHFFLQAIGEPGLEQWDRVALFLLVGALITSLTTVLRVNRRRLADGLWREQKARAEAEAANQTKDDFLSLISHELQTPVSVVQGWATAIRKRQLHGEALNVALDAIERNAQVQSRLVQDHSRPVADRERTLAPRAADRIRLGDSEGGGGADAADLRSSITCNSRPRFGTPSTTCLRTRSGCSRCSPICCRMRSKFTPPGGHIAVEASCTSSTVVVTIKDDGVGISPEFLPHVFDGLQQDPRTVGVCHLEASDLGCRSPGTSWNATAGRSGPPVTEPARARPSRSSCPCSHNRRPLTNDSIPTFRLAPFERSRCYWWKTTRMRGCY